MREDLRTPKPSQLDITFCRDAGAHGASQIYHRDRAFVSIKVESGRWRDIDVEIDRSPSFDLDLGLSIGSLGGRGLGIAVALFGVDHDLVGIGAVRRHFYRADLVGHFQPARFWGDGKS